MYSTDCWQNVGRSEDDAAFILEATHLASGLEMDFTISLSPCWEFVTWFLSRQKDELLFLLNGRFLFVLMETGSVKKL